MEDEKGAERNVPFLFLENFSASFGISFAGHKFALEKEYRGPVSSSKVSQPHSDVSLLRLIACERAFDPPPSGILSDYFCAAPQLI